MCNKKVLLRERNRHTARRVANTPFVVLTRGVLHPRMGDPVMGYPPIWTWFGYPHPDLPGGTPSQDRDGVLPSGPGPGWVPSIFTCTWLGYPPSWTLMGYLPRCEQTENITVPHHSNTGPKNIQEMVAFHSGKGYFRCQRGYFWMTCRGIFEWLGKYSWMVM